MWKCGNEEYEEMWRCVDVEIWRCVDVEMCRCGDMDVWRCGCVEMRSMRRCGDV